VLERYARHGIRVGKIQVSAGLSVPLPTDRRALEPFADPIYLHQVTQRNADGSLRQFPDLPPALAAPPDEAAREWRIHFHTPLFVEGYGQFGSTRSSIVETFEALERHGGCRILEIETYTWDVLPAELKVELTESIAREYAWVLDALGELA
jgi:hypothetical protein